MRRTGRLLAATAVLLATGFIGLALVQWRWIAELSEAQERRERDVLQFAARQFAEDFDGEVNRILVAFQNTDASDLEKRLAEWRSTARDPRLVESLYLVDADVVRIVDAEGKAAETTWPSALASVKAQVADDERRRRSGPLVASIPAVLVPLRRRPPDLAPELAVRPDGLVPEPREAERGWQPPPWRVIPPRGHPAFEDRRGMPGPPEGGRPFPPGGRPPAEGEGFRPPFAPDGRPIPQGPEWRPQGPPGGPQARQPVRPRPMPRGPIIAVFVLSREHMTGSAFPDLARRLGSVCDFAVHDGTTIVYRSNPRWPESAAMEAEVRVPLLRVGPAGDGSGWQILARNRGGAVAELVEAARRRNLVVGSAVLFVLALSFVLLAVIARRAEKLRLQQMEFVAGITHELNTPLAALRSAGQNLADGVVSEREQVGRYGSMIAREAARLADLVAQILDFAGLQAKRSLRAEAIAVSEWVAAAVDRAKWLAEESAITIETDVPSPLPGIAGDPRALGRALDNLLANAIRHGGSGKWVGITARTTARGVAVTVADRGRGLRARELSRLFEPFFRGEEAAQASGSGLGLAIVRQIVQRHGGRVRAERRGEGGAAFTIELPASPAQAAVPAVVREHG